MHTSLALAVTAAAFASAQTLNVTTTTSGYTNYSTVTGYFLQDLATTNATTFDYTTTNFGLINQTYASGVAGDLTQWQQFEAQVNALNANAPLDTVYKVLFMGRHGEGWHNAAQTYYGTPAWNCYWAEVDGNATAYWEDADLTPAGVTQALVAANFWQHQITNQHIPYPQSYYTSPLTRCLRTANLTFSALDLPHYYPFVPTVRELFREGISIHTCDHRSSRSSIAARFPTYNIDSDLTETDEIWNGITAETSAAQDARSKKVLDSVFTTDDHTWLSITSHSGEIASILRVLGHQVFSLNTGAVIPVLVKAQFLPSGPAPSSPAYTASTHCAAPPVTSIATLAQGCVCSGTVVGGITTRVDGNGTTSTASLSAAKTTTVTASTSKTSTASKSTSKTSTATKSTTKTTLAPSHPTAYSTR